MENALIKEIEMNFKLQAPRPVNIEELHALLSKQVNILIQKDFQKLISILYRIDVSEEKLKYLLKNVDDDAGNIMATLIIERYQQKIKTRQEFNQTPNNRDDCEKL
jgi:hypothetical protein